jgi:hypothetical protein
LIRPTTDPQPGLVWILEEVQKTHTLGRTFRNEQWTMTWFEYEK